MPEWLRLSGYSDASNYDVEDDKNKKESQRALEHGSRDAKKQRRQPGKYVSVQASFFPIFLLIYYNFPLILLTVYIYILFKFFMNIL